MTLEELNAKYGKPSVSVAPTQTAINSIVSEAESRWGSGAPTVDMKSLTGFEKYQKTSSDIGKKIGDMGAKVVKTLTSSEQKFGKTIGETIVAGDTISQAQENKSNEQAMTLRVLRQIADDKKQGKDTTHLEWVLAKQAESNPDIIQQIKDIVPSLDKTTKQVLGEAGGVLADIVLAGSSAPKVVGAGKKSTGIVKGVIQGAKEGAIGGATAGAMQGVTRSAQENAGASDIVKSGVGGAVGGAITGGVLGGATGGVRGYVNKGNQDPISYATELTSPKVTTKTSEEAIAQGRVTSPGLLKKSEIVPTKKDQMIAESVADIVSPKNNIVENIDAINQRISQTNQGVKNLIADNKIPFNGKQLRTRLNLAKEDSKLVFASDKTAERTYNAVVDEFMKHVDKKDTLGLFEARQTFDKVPAIKKLLDSERLGENVKKQIVLDVRRAANEYIAEQLPANNPYRSALMRESRMIEAIGNIADKNASTIGMNKLQIWAKEYPVLKWIIGGSAAGVVGGAGVGVGSSIIGSTN